MFKSLDTILHQSSVKKNKNLLTSPSSSLTVRNSPVIQDGDDLSWLESQLVVFSGFKVIDGSDFPAIGLVWREQAGGAGVKAGQGGLRLLTLLLQGELDGWGEEVTGGNIFQTQKQSTEFQDWHKLLSTNLFQSVNFLCCRQCFSPLAKSSSSFLFVDVEGSLATKAGLALACSAALKKRQTSSIYILAVRTAHSKICKKMWWIYFYLTFLRVKLFKATWEPTAGKVTPCSRRFLIIAEMRLSWGSLRKSSAHSTIRAFSFSHTLGCPWVHSPHKYYTQREAAASRNI